ncbi:hypothetical protein COCSUDRAFT_43149 [Coccomyxa subellipsoidea C-169]|uniref:Uncharacterized protein n=1 Tax=Coccomyxa subellipsoidea (strain C-169) TaxID=574566 RepID=I0YSP3_COCSC|nr:hypothetical protein COCSUDRAFT_43149 [Coccomyxa subellipsoidea C-169]EIE21412.1 hypothetical protein COCSUDRAFT_43149 [Coccomyxa subellipsoidea C-169]|eukprot:XP_005645956.1 hypothetical protein COCSUDRAFT_43149 [Coccomyxa subellipsoidea C-169]
MIVPSLRQLLGMWRDRFGYMPLTLSEAEALDNRIVSPDTDSAQLLKKCLAPSSAPAPQTPHRTLRSGRAQEINSLQQEPEQGRDMPGPSPCQEKLPEAAAPVPALPAAKNEPEQRSSAAITPDSTGKSEATAAISLAGRSESAGTGRGHACQPCKASGACRDSAADTCGRQMPMMAPRPNLQQQQAQQDAFIARGIAMSLRQYVKGFHEELLQKNEAMAKELARLRQENEQLKYQAREASRQSAVPQQAEPTTVTQPDQDARACMLPSHVGQPKPHLEGKAPATEAAAPATATPDLPAERLDMATPQAASAAAAEGCGLPTHGHSRGVPIGLECRSSGTICDGSAREQVFPPDPSSPPTESASVEKPSDADSEEQKQPDKIMVDAAAAVDLALNEAAQGAAASSREQLATLTATREATLPSAACIHNMHATLTEAYNSGFGSQCTAPDEQVLDSLEHMQEDGSDAAMTASQERCEEGCGSRQEADRAADGAEGASCRPDQAAGGVHAAVSEPGQAAEELHDKLGSVVALVSAVCGSFSPHETAGALLQNLQGVLAEIQHDAAQIALQLSSAEPASQVPAAQPAGISQDDDITTAAPCTMEADSQAAMQPDVDGVATLQPADSFNGQTAPAGAHSSAEGSEHKQQEEVTTAKAAVAQFSGDASGPKQEPENWQPRLRPKAHSAAGRAAASARTSPRSAGVKGKSAPHSWPSAMRRAVKSVFSLGTARLVPRQRTPLQQAASKAAEEHADDKGTRHAEEKSAPFAPVAPAATKTENILGAAEARKPGKAAAAGLQDENTAPQQRSQDTFDTKLQASDHADESAEALVCAAAPTTAPLSPRSMRRENAGDPQTAEVAAQPQTVHFPSQADTMDSMQQATTTAQRTQLLFDSLKKPLLPGSAKRKAPGEDGSSAAWEWAVPFKQQRTLDASSLPSAQDASTCVRQTDSGQHDDFEGQVSMEVALQQTAMFCSQLGSSWDD